MRVLNLFAAILGLSVGIMCTTLGYIWVNPLEAWLGGLNLALAFVNLVNMNTFT